MSRRLHERDWGIERGLVGLPVPADLPQATASEAEHTRMPKVPLPITPQSETEGTFQGAPHNWVGVLGATFRSQQVSTKAPDRLDRLCLV